MRIKQDNRIGKVIILGLIWSGSLFLFLHFLGYYKVTKAKSWPLVEAFVSHCEISESSEISYGGKTGTHVHTHSDLIFEFNYTVTGHRYVSSRFYAWGLPRAYSVAREYPLGKHFEAHYNPVYPSEAVVEPGNAGYVYLVTSLALLGLAVLASTYNFSQK